MKIARTIRRMLRLMGMIILFFLTYFLFAVAIAYIPSNADFRPGGKDAVEIYILTNGIHTDIVVPLRNHLKDWSSFVNPADTRSGEKDQEYVAFGWGDKGFYLNRPAWDYLRFVTAFNAMFFMNRTVMHVTFHKKLQQGESCRKIQINEENYRILITYIENSFDSKDHLAKLIPNTNTGPYDLFYDAKGTYSIFYTCNTWANNGLKTAGLRSCVWTLFKDGIFDKYD